MSSPPYRSPDSIDLGHALGEWRRTWQQTLGVLLIVIAFLTPGVWMLAAGANLAIALLALAGGLAVDALIARQVIANLNVRWTLYERGFARACLGREVRLQFEDVAAFVILPAREALVTLVDGRTLRIEGFAGSAEAAQRIDAAIANAWFARYDDRIARGETVVLGPLSITRDTIRVDDRDFERGRTTLHEESDDIGVHGNTHGFWTLEGPDGSTARIALAQIPLPSVARALIGSPRA